MSTVRLRRLQADYENLRVYVNKHPRLQLIQTEGEPPERYQLEYHISGLRQQDSDLKVVKTHLVEISLPRNYPRTPPLCRMLTPIFHPNIAPHAICIGDHWSAGESLSSIVARIGELIAYQSYNVKSPLNGEAARWVSENTTRLPLDPVSMLVEEGNGAPPASAAMAPVTSRASASPPAAAPSTASRPTTQSPASPPPRPGPPRPAPPHPAPLSSVSMPSVPPTAAARTIFPCTGFPCTGCGAKIRVTPALSGKRVRCPKCNTVLTLPTL